MKCVMCGNTGGHTGFVVFGIERNYRLCGRCLKFHKHEFEIEVDNSMSKRAQTTLMRKYVQEQVDEKLNRYLLEV
jgi:hypothetical protein